MNFKEQIISNFNKESFSLKDHSTNGKLNGKWEAVDPHIREFVKRVNESENINTLYSCEGHGEKDSAYFFFNVNEKGWDIFYGKVVPELSHALTFIDDSILNILFNITTSTYGTKGIAIHCNLEQTGIYWQDIKERFWKEIDIIFTKYFL